MQPAKQAHELFGTLISTGKGVARSAAPDRTCRRGGGRGRLPISYAPATQAIFPASPPHSFGYAIVPMISLIEFSRYLADVEEHLGETISVIQPNMKVPLNEFEGRIQYGEKRRRVGKGWMFYANLSNVIKKKSMTDLNVKVVGDFLQGNLHRLFPVGSIFMTKKL